MTGPTLAEQRYAILIQRPDVRYADQLRANLEQIGALRPGRPWPIRAPEFFGLPIGELVERCGRQCVDALIEAGYDRTQMSLLTVGIAWEEEYVARYGPEEDGSGLVLISDSTLSLCRTYADYIGRAYEDLADGGLARLFGRLVRMVVSGRLGSDSAELAGMLRFHAVNRRLYGVVTELGHRDVDDPGSFSGGDFFLEPAIRFVIAHEAAHHALRDDASPPAETSPAVEAEADRLALKIATRTLKRDHDDLIRVPFLRERWRQEWAEFHALVGALIAMMAVEFAETATQVRLGATHLPAAERAQDLADAVLGDERLAEHERAIGRIDRQWRSRFSSDRLHLEAIRRDLIEATGLAAAFTPARRFLWEEFFAAAPVPRPEDDFVAGLGRRDVLMCAPDAVLAELLGATSLHDGTLLLLDGDIPGALTAWRAPPRAQTYQAEKTPLAFSTIVRYLREGFGHQHPLDHAVAAATLLSRRMPVNDQAPAPGTRAD